MEQSIIKFLKSHDKNQYRYKDLLKHLKIPSNSISRFKQILQKLVDEKKVIRDKGNRYRIALMAEDLTGELFLTQKGFGFVITGTDAADIFVGRGQMQNAVNGDRVRVKVTRGSTLERRRGYITEVLERKTSRFLGPVQKKGSEYWLQISPVTPERGIRIVNQRSVDIKNGYLVEVRVKDWGTALTPILVEVTDVIGDAADPGNDFTYIVRKYDYREVHPQAALNEALQFTEQSIHQEVSNRRDLRHLVCFTIDPVDARDFDDAISIRKTKAGWELGVHIADVSHYVRDGSALDREAFNRATSVYFTEGVIHMLPEHLSAGMCSLKPDEDRLAMTALIYMTPTYEVQSYEVFPSVIRSRKRLTYENAQAILEGAETSTVSKEIKQLAEVCRTLQDQRELLGSIDFDIPEPVFILGAEGIPREFRPKERLFSHRMVEECMLLANRLVAERYGSSPASPFVFRIHDRPTEENLARFLNLMKRLKVHVPQQDAVISSGDIRRLLASIENSPFKGLIESVALRTMTKAQYSTMNHGHFGLAFKHYTHFTSPIRRYPDLLVHRRIKELLRKLPAKRDQILAVLDAGCQQTNTMELLALSAEREYIKVKQLRWLDTQIGNTFEGIISGVINIGFFVELADSLAEGLVHIDTLEERDLQFVEDDYLLRSKSGKTVYQMGDTVKVRVVSVSMERQRANFVKVEPEK